MDNNWNQIICIVAFLIVAYLVLQNKIGGKSVKEHMGTVLHDNFELTGDVSFTSQNEFTNTTMNNTTFSGAQIDNANIANPTLSGAKMDQPTLTNAQLAGATISSPTVSGDMTIEGGVTFKGEAKFEGQGNSNSDSENHTGPTMVKKIVLTSQEDCVSETNNVLAFGAHVYSMFSRINVISTDGRDIARVTDVNSASIHNHPAALNSNEKRHYFEAEGVSIVQTVGRHHGLHPHLHCKWLICPSPDHNHFWHGGEGADANRVEITFDNPHEVRQIILSGVDRDTHRMENHTLLCYDENDKIVRSFTTGSWRGDHRHNLKRTYDL